MPQKAEPQHRQMLNGRGSEAHLEVCEFLSSGAGRRTRRGAFNESRALRGTEQTVQALVNMGWPHRGKYGIARTRAHRRT